MLASNDQELLNALLTRWAAEYGPDVLRTIRRHGVRAADAEDVMQETLIKAYQQLRNHQSMPAHPKGWLKRIAVHAAVDHLRKQAAEARRIGRLGNSGKVRGSYSPFADGELEAMLERLLALLDAKRSFDPTLTVVKLWIFDGCSFAQIGDRLGFSAMTASRWCKQGLERLREALEDRDINSLPDRKEAEKKAG